MDIMYVYMVVGFSLAGYSVMANDSVQTLGTFIASNQKWFKWYTLAAAASAAAAVEEEEELRRKLEEEARKGRQVRVNPPVGSLSSVCSMRVAVPSSLTQKSNTPSSSSKCLNANLDVMIGFHDCKICTCVKTVPLTVTRP